MNLEIGEANTYNDKTGNSETRDNDAAVIKSIAGYSSTLKNRCVAYMDSPESDFSYEQLAELVKAYRVYSRSCGDIVRLIYEFYDYDEIKACEKTVDITKDNFSEHISAAKKAVEERLDECRKKYNETFYTEDEEECAKILREVRAERRSLEELMRLFESLNNSFEVYFDRLDSEALTVPVADMTDAADAGSTYDETDEAAEEDEAYEGTFSIPDYPVEEDEYPAAEEYPPEEVYTEGETAEEAEDTENDSNAEETAEEEIEKISEKINTLEDILAEFSEDEDYGIYSEDHESDDGDEYGYSEAYSLYTEGEAEEDYSEEYGMENVTVPEEAEDTEEPEAENEESDRFEEEFHEEPQDVQDAEEIYGEQEQVEFDLPELPSEDDISDGTDTAAEKTDEEKFIDFIENSRFETYKAVFESGGDIKREINITTIAESDFTKLHGKDKWSENNYINEVFGIYRQYTSISADDSEIRRGIIRAGAVKKISDFLTSVGAEASAENIMQIDRLCPIEFSAPDAAVIETDSSYILSVFKAVYDYLRSDRTVPIAVTAASKKKDPEPYSEAEEVFFDNSSEKFFEFSSDGDYDDYETSKYVAADYEAAARENEDTEESRQPENTAEPEYSFDEKYHDNTRENTFESGVSESTEYEEYVKDPEPTAETGAPITMILNGKEAVYPNWAEAERAFCEYAIKAKPFAMALINRRNDNINGQKIFNRATYEMPNTISLSNGLQAYAAGSKEDFLEICGRVMNICSIEKDIYKIIESGALGE